MIIKTSLNVCSILFLLINDVISGSIRKYIKENWGNVNNIPHNSIQLTSQSQKQLHKANNEQERGDIQTTKRFGLTYSRKRKTPELEKESNNSTNRFGLTPSRKRIAPEQPNEDKEASNDENAGNDQTNKTDEVNQSKLERKRARQRLYQRNKRRARYRGTPTEKAKVKEYFDKINEQSKKRSRLITQKIQNNLASTKEKQARLLRYERKNKKYQEIREKVHNRTATEKEIQSRLNHNQKVAKFYSQNREEINKRRRELYLQNKEKQKIRRKELYQIAKTKKSS